MLASRLKEACKWVLGLSRRVLARLLLVSRINQAKWVFKVGFAFWRHLGWVLGCLTRLLGLARLAGARCLRPGLLLCVLDEPLGLSLICLPGLS